LREPQLKPIKKKEARKGGKRRSDLQYIKNLLERTSQNIKEISNYFEQEPQTEPKKTVTISRKLIKRNDIITRAKPAPTKGVIMQEKPKRQPSKTD
jgi:5-bromo-4-chloroindolyl phosphate hydrolysis protein